MEQWVYTCLCFHRHSMFPKISACRLTTKFGCRNTSRKTGLRHDSMSTSVHPAMCSRAGRFGALMAQERVMYRSLYRLNLMRHLGSPSWASLVTLRQLSSMWRMWHLIAVIVNLRTATRRCAMLRQLNTIRTVSIRISKKFTQHYKVFVLFSKDSYPFSADSSPFSTDSSLFAFLYRKPHHPNHIMQLTPIGPIPAYSNVTGCRPWCTGCDRSV